MESTFIGRVVQSPDGKWERPKFEYVSGSVSDALVERLESPVTPALRTMNSAAAGTAQQRLQEEAEADEEERLQGQAGQPRVMQFVMPLRFQFDCDDGRRAASSIIREKERERVKLESAMMEGLPDSGAACRARRQSRKPVLQSPLSTAEEAATLQEREREASCNAERLLQELEEEHAMSAAKAAGKGRRSKKKRAGTAHGQPAAAAAAAAAATGGARLISEDEQAEAEAAACTVDPQEQKDRRCKAAVDEDKKGEDEERRSKEEQEKQWRVREKKGQEKAKVKEEPQRKDAQEEETAEGVEGLAGGEPPAAALPLPAVLPPPQAQQLMAHIGMSGSDSDLPPCVESRPATKAKLKWLFTTGKCSRFEMDNKIIASLCDFPDATGVQIVEHFAEADMSSIRNKCGYFAGVMKRLRSEHSSFGGGARGGGGYGGGYGAPPARGYRWKKAEEEELKRVSMILMEKAAAGAAQQRRQEEAETDEEERLQGQAGELTFLSKFSLAPCSIAAGPVARAAGGAATTVSDASDVVSAALPSVLIVCQECDEDAEATHSCEECSVLLCDDCKKHHCKRKKTKHHALLTVAKIKARMHALDAQLVPITIAHTTPPEQREKECVVCLQGQPTVEGWAIFVPCGHMCVCKACADSIMVTRLRLLLHTHSFRCVALLGARKHGGGDCEKEKARERETEAVRERERRELAHARALTHTCARAPAY
jgi:hypothetical protein